MIEEPMTAARPGRIEAFSVNEGAVLAAPAGEPTLVSLVAQSAEEPTEEKDLEEITEGELPLAAFVQSSEANGSWAIVDLLCMLAVLCALVSLLVRKNSSALPMSLEFVLAVSALAIFTATQSFGAEVKLVDAVTPLMLTLAAASTAIARRCGTESEAA